MSSFARYRYIKAEDILKANIRSNHVSEDAASLSNALNSLTYITKPEFQRASGLHANVIQKLDAKPHTLKLLECLGYQKDAKGNYNYQQTKSEKESLDRQNAANEFQQFFNDLKKIKDGALTGFEEYINSSNKRPQPRRDDEEVYYEEQPQRTTSSTSFRPPSPPSLPSSSKVKEGNEKTARTIKSFKESIVPRHGGRAAHSFIRRKLLLLLLKQRNPDLSDVDDDFFDGEIGYKIGRLRQNDNGPDAGSGDEVYFECLIRANFDERAALEILRNKRPNLKPPPEPEQPRGPTTTTLASGLPHFQQNWRALNEHTDENGAAQVLLYEGDEWKNAVHIVTAIIELRQQYRNQEVNDLMVSRMYRLIYTELSKVVGRQSALKIEFLAYAICKVSPDSLQHLNMVDIKDILRSTGDTQIREDFQENAIKTLSMECPICMESFPRSRMEIMFLCNHTCCLNCAKDYYRRTIKEIRDSAALKKLTCFQEEHEISEEIRLNFFQYIGSKLNQWFTDERLILDAYHENLFHATRDSQTKKCGNTRCVSFFNINNNRILRVQCPHCHFQQCQQCCRKWHKDHDGKDCEQYADWLKDNDPDDPEVQLTKYLNTAGMMCPNEKCKGVYEYKAGGCEHFECPACKTEFCRTCSSLFYNPNRGTNCPRANCGQKATLHAHCYLNCFREIRDAEVDQITGLLTAHKIDHAEELRQKPTATGPVCPVEDCKNASSVACENRFCDRCYKEFLCLLVWRNELPPWELYTDNNLGQKLAGASVVVPANAARPALIALAQQHLVQFTGKPKKIPKNRLS